ncbi:Hypothetical protein NCS54_00421400 [Fusarium falciforme]|uniref:Hypothetical protein n=1 Tax=Fusarium falciforme TaxID=195108 RepID=UPI00230193CD|nr:Hypothetical protein NCS54_00421400 [Fusarium falciforme]WAO86924.1 Hypothetical protein NCS54_00421400 [Fusarium falciforme]
MISRAARVPRICLACRFGLTQRSAVLGFRAAPITQSLGQRRRYTSEIGKTGDGKIESFITGANISTESKSKEEETPEQTETVTKPDDTTTDIKSFSEAETTSETAPKPQDDQDVKPTSDTQSKPPAAESLSEKPIDPVQETQDETTTQASTPASTELPLDSSEKNSDSSAEHPAESSEDSMFELPVIPELEPTVLQTKRFHHDLVHDESLGVSALGVPADAIIINNPNQIRRSKKAPTVVQSRPVQPPSELDWNSLTPSEEEGELSAEDIYRNIDELRPDTRFLRDSEIEKLTEVLRNGFTTDQLKEYSRLHKAEVVPEDVINYSWVVKHYPWVPRTKIDVRGGQDKLACVQKVIYDTWKIQSQKYMDDLGNVMVQMQPDSFVFLTFESERMVRELREDFLVGEEETITLNRKHHRLHIVARKATAYGILAHLDQILQKRVVRDIPIQEHVALIPSSTELEVLSQLTKTTLKIVGKKELRVSWLPGPQENAAESKTEDVGDVVLRLLLGHPSPGREVDMECLPRPQTKGIPKDHFIDFRRQLKSLSWRDKLQTWQRVVTPISNKPDEVSPVPLDLVGSASLPEYQPDKLGSRNVTTATFGHIIHNSSQVGNLKETETRKKKAQSPDADADDLIIPLHIDDLSTPGIDDGPKKPIPGAVLSHKRRTFYPLIPHPASFSALKPEGSDTLTQSTTIILNLAVHGDRSAGNRQGPVIQVHLPVDAEADLANFSIPKDAAAYCVIPWYRNDLLLPGESVDVRIQHERRLALDMDKTGLRSFLDSSEFNLLQGHLRTPSQATLVLPPKYINPGTRGVKPKSQTYAFRGLEIHQTVEMPWRDHTLRYSSIEAGQHGGQRQELTLQAGKPDDLGTSFEGEKRKSFLQLVEDMATGQCFSWTEGYESIKSRQLEDHSYDLPEEELTEDIIVDDGKFNTHSRPNLRRYEGSEQPRKEYMPRRGARDTPPRSKKFDVLEEMEQFGEADESEVTEPKVREPEAKESEVDQTSTSKPDSTASEAKELEAREAELDQASVDKSDVTAEEIKEPETKEPKVDQTNAKKPQKGRKGAKSKSPTELLHSFLDQFADPISLTTPISLKTPTSQPSGDRHVNDAALTNNILLKEVVTRFNARQAQEDSRARQAQEKPEARQPQEKPAARQLQEKSTPPSQENARQPQQDSRVRQAQENSGARQAQEDSTARQSQEKPVARQPTNEDDFEAKFSARVTDKPLKAPSPAKKSKKGTTKQNNKAKKQQATPHSTQFKDPFAAAFTNRLATTHQRTSSGGDGFFDDLPKPDAKKKEKPHFAKMAAKKAAKKKPQVKKDRWQGRGRVRGKRR